MRLERYGASLFSAADLSRLAYPSYLSAHALATLDGMSYESRRGNSDLCSGSDVKMFGVAWTAVSGREFRLILRAVFAISCRAGRSLEFSAMTVTEDGRKVGGACDCGR